MDTSLTPRKPFYSSRCTVTSSTNSVQTKKAIRYVGKAWLASRTFIPPAHLHHDGIDIGFKESYIEREDPTPTKTSLPVLLHYEDRMSMSQL